MFKKIEEGKAKVFVPEETKISKELPVFYNLVMKLNRDISVLLLRSLEIPDMIIADPMAGTGVRGIRFEKELPKMIIESISVNDNSEDAIKLIERNIKLNKCSKIRIANKDANLFMLESKGFDYIDIDPFGTPNPFLDSAIKRLSRNGILAVTATDTSALSGTYPAACRRKYFARPIRNELKHEAGIRILIRKIQLIAAQYDKALFPILSYSKDHYFRIFFRNKKGKSAVDDVIHEHRFLRYCNKCGKFELANTNKESCCEVSMEYAGPMWAGSLGDYRLLVKMSKENIIEQNSKFIEILKNEYRVKAPFFYDLHTISKRFGLSFNPRKDDIIRKIKNSGYKASETHFLGTGIKTTIPNDELIELVKKAIP